MSHFNEDFATLLRILEVDMPTRRITVRQYLCICGLGCCASRYVLDITCLPKGTLRRVWKKPSFDRPTALYIVRSVMSLNSWCFLLLSHESSGCVKTTPANYSYYFASGLELLMALVSYLMSVIRSWNCCPEAFSLILVRIYIQVLLETWS